MEKYEQVAAGAAAADDSLEEKLIMGCWRIRASIEWYEEGRNQVVFSYADIHLKFVN